MSSFTAMSSWRAKSLGAVILIGLTAGLAQAADSNTYQVTGPVIGMTPTTITVQKDNEKWEIARDQVTPVRGGDLKVGSRVTVKYRMTAISVEVKPAAK
jgi:RNase P/RNase MRP subunit p29